MTKEEHANCKLQVASVRNILGKISRKRIILWWVSISMKTYLLSVGMLTVRSSKILALSSVPIHLLYNSSVFKTLDANLYDALVVNQDFLKGDPFATKISITNGYGSGYTSYVEDLGPSYPRLRGIQDFFANNYENKSVVENLTNADCMTAYGNFFVLVNLRIFLNSVYN